MIFYHITFDSGDFRKNSGVFSSKTCVHRAVRKLTSGFAFVVFLSVVVEKIMKQTGSCGGTGVKMKLFAYKICVVGYIEAMLEACRRDMVSDILEPVKLRAVDYIADEGEVSVRGEILF